MRYVESFENTGAKLKNKAFSLILAGIFFALLPPTLNAAGFLHTSAQDISDENGNKILLRGVSLGNWMLPEGYMWKFGGQGDRPRKIEKIVADLAGPDY